MVEEAINARNACRETITLIINGLGFSLDTKWDQEKKLYG